MAGLDSMAAPRGVLWRVVPSNAIPNGMTLMCEDLDSPLWLASDLSMTDKEANAALFRFELCPAFRGGKGSVSVVMYHHTSNLVLASSESRHTVFLMTEEEVDTKSKDVLLYNKAWEFSIDAEEDGVNGEDASGFLTPYEKEPLAF
ncbi:hypothetical protein KIPB_001772 [Kipferlia bialata]|uniref:Uncharacterized protein n=1 Tax=Kipferlia bialata TaxID=797122 RepID=A0A391NIZ3_9EUKA|nr:hypothetical protein KIPB_001772 [Kipferlia bialata]|eukprot:g1772.t1